MQKSKKLPLRERVKRRDELAQLTTVLRCHVAFNGASLYALRHLKFGGKVPTGEQLAEMVQRAVNRELEQLGLEAA